MLAFLNVRDVSHELIKGLHGDLMRKEAKIVLRHFQRLHVHPFFAILSDLHDWGLCPAQ